MRYDTAIIGSGPGGVSAAITLSIRNKNVVIISSSRSSDKMRKAHQILNYPGFPNVSGEELADSLERHVNSLDVKYIDKKAGTVYSMGEYFAIDCGDPAGPVEASTLILATGVVNGKPLPGESEYLGRGVSYCATCDAMLYRNKAVAVIGYSAKEESEAEFLSEVCSEVSYFPVYKNEPDPVFSSDKIRVIKEAPVSVSAAAEGNRRLSVETDEGSHPFDGVFILRDAISPSGLIPGIETEGPHVKVDRTMATNIPGCFACGDITGEPYQYIKAAGEGNVAALSAVKYLNALKYKK